MSSTERPLTAPATSEDDQVLLTVARGSVVHGLTHGEPLPIDPGVFPRALQEPRACFVTHRVSGALRGCVGTLEATTPLVAATARNAYRAAFEDSRFPALTKGELPGLATHVSILEPLVKLDVASEQELLRRLRPGIDGLVVRAGHRSGLYLPVVWGQLDDPHEFVRSLKQKAGLPRDAWSSEWRWHRFTTRDVG